MVKERILGGGPRSVAASGAGLSVAPEPGACPTGRSVRFVELDLLRGLAVFGMVIFHFFFILDFYGVKESEMFSGLWHVLGQFVRFTFLGLVGVGMVISSGRVRGGNLCGRMVLPQERREELCVDGLSRGVGKWQWVLRQWRMVVGGVGLRLPAMLRQWRRALIVGIAAMAVTVATYFYLGEEYYVRFGILHLIVVSIFFWSFFVRWKWVVLVLSLVSFWFGGWFGWLGLGGLSETGLAFLSIGGDSGITYFLRASAGNPGALDFFPIFPWIGVVGVGIFLGHIFYPDGKRKFDWMAGQKAQMQVRKFNFFTLMGRHSLLIYVVHVPVIMALLWAFSYDPPIIALALLF